MEPSPTDAENNAESRAVRQQWQFSPVYCTTEYSGHLQVISIEVNVVATTTDPMDHQHVVAQVESDDRSVSTTRENMPVPLSHSSYTTVVTHRKSQKTGGGSEIL